MNIYLTGMMGCGKTTLGRYAAQYLFREFIDLDELIEEREGVRIESIFSKYGESGFRKVETQALEQVSKKKNCIIATGGGTVTCHKNIELMNSTGNIIFINRNINEIITTLNSKGRPLLLKITPQEIFSQRYDIYLKTADFVIQCNEGIEHSICELVSILEGL